MILIFFINGGTKQNIEFVAGCVRSKYMSLTLFIKKIKVFFLLLWPWIGLASQLSSFLTSIWAWIFISKILIKVSTVLDWIRTTLGIQDLNMENCGVTNPRDRNTETWIEKAKKFFDGRQVYWIASDFSVQKKIIWYKKHRNKNLLFYSSTKQSLNSADDMTIQVYK